MKCLVLDHIKLKLRSRAEHIILTNRKANRKLSIMLAQDSTRLSHLSECTMEFIKIIKIFYMFDSYPDSSNKYEHHRNHLTKCS